MYFLLLLWIFHVLTDLLLTDFQTIGFSPIFVNDR